MGEESVSTLSNISLGEGSSRGNLNESLLGILQKDEERGDGFMGGCPLNGTEKRERVEGALFLARSLPV